MRASVQNLNNYPARFGLVDAFRGCAALAVVLAHLRVDGGGAAGDHGAHRVLFPYGCEAVLVFFVISGYCIAASAHNCMERGFAFREFMWRRLKRIYPPYLFAISFWAATRYVKYATSGEWTLDRPFVEWLQNLTLTQWVPLMWDPINSPASNSRLFVAAFWSLCYEEQFYLVMAGLLALSGRFPRAVLHGSIALGVVSIGWGAFFPTEKFGIFIEYWAAFATGLLAFHRLCLMRDDRAKRAVDLSLMAVALVSGYIAWFAGVNWGDPPQTGDVFVNSWSSLAVAATMALVLIMLRPFDAQYLALRPLSAPLAGLAAISYSLYLTHQFCLAFATGVARRVLGFIHLPTEGPILWTGHVLVLLGIATVFWYFCERPFLNTRRSERIRPRHGSQESGG